MAKYRLAFKKSVVKDFERIPKEFAAKLLSRIKGLAEDPRPRGSAKLAGQERYRLRQGDYRVLYEIREDELLVTVVKAAHRKDAYR